MFSKRFFLMASLVVMGWVGTVGLTIFSLPVAVAQSLSFSRFGSARFGASVLGGIPVAVPATHPLTLGLMVPALVSAVYLYTQILRK